MPAFPEVLERLMAALGKLPGIGPRSAERIALHIVQTDLEAVRTLVQTIAQARERIQACTVCGALTETQPCLFCSDPRRDPAQVCVVETPVDVIRLDKSGAFRGKYHVLGGRISPINGIGPEDLRIADLERRLAEGVIKEVIVALGSDVEGDATSFYLAKRLAAAGVKVTRLAHGLPAGGGLEFADELTLTHALEGRREIS